MRTTFSFPHRTRCTSSKKKHWDLNWRIMIKSALAIFPAAHFRRFFHHEDPFTGILIFRGLNLFFMLFACNPCIIIIKCSPPKIYSHSWTYLSPFASWSSSELSSCSWSAKTDYHSRLCCYSCCCCRNLLRTGINYHIRTCSIHP